MARRTRERKRAKLDPHQASQPVVALKSPSRGVKTLGTLFFTTAWVGIVVAITLHEAPLHFTIIFGAVGLFLIGASIHTVLSLFTPKATVEIRPGNIYPGSGVDMRWRIGGRVDLIEHLTIHLQCINMTYEIRGDRRTLVKKPLHDEQIFDTGQPTGIVQGTLRFKVPNGMLPSQRMVKNSAIRWQLLFQGTIPHRPDLKQELPFLVYPVSE